MSEELRDKQRDLYIDFLLNCTTQAKSVNNYKKFGRINECLQQLFPDRKGISILDFQNADEFAAVVSLLEENQLYQQYNEQGNREYQGTVASYLRFLKAKKLFANENYVKKEWQKKNLVTSRSSHIGLLTALKTKPFLLLAGISGTGKSRIVRHLAYATGGENPESVQRPFNFEMIQVRPNWHDSSDLLGYVTRVSGKAEYVMTDFVRFLAKAWYFEDVPFFLCLDEMNLAPVEQYFAEYLSVLETRKLRDGKIVSDPLIPALDGLDGKKNGFRVSDPMLDDVFGHEWTKDGEVVDIDKQREDKLRLQFRKEGISLPPNLFVVGTVNMDETTFSFSRKVLDRAMTIEMNAVNLRSGLTKDSLLPEQIDKTLVLPDAVEAADVYDDGNQTCELTLQYLESINNCLEGTPFKIAYRTRNEFLVYVVHRVGMTEGDKCKALVSALDEMTFMKILSRIEGDKKKLTDKDGNQLLEKLEETVSKALSMAKENYKSEGNKMVEMPSSQSIAKLGGMKQKLEKNYYCTFWD